MKKVLSVLLCALMLVGVLPIGIFASSTSETTYTMWGNNLKQCAIHENGITYDENDFLVNDVKPTKRYKDFYKTMQDNMPSIIALQECDLGWHDLLEDIDGVGTAEGVSPISTLGYQLVIDKAAITVTNGKGTFEFEDCRRGLRNPIYFDTAVFKLVDAGVVAYDDASNAFYEDPWTFTWAVLEDKTNGNQVGVTSTHVRAGEGQASNREKYAKELRAKTAWIETTYNVPVISMGDYNAIMSEASCQVHYAEMNVARYIAKETAYLEYRTSGNPMGGRPGLSDENESGIIDHCFISKNGIAPEKYEVRVDDNSYSDHVPHLLTFRILGTSHEHTYDENAQYNEAEHKLICSECYNVEYEAHNFGDGYFPTEGTELTHERRCEVCGYGDKSEHTVAEGEKVDSEGHRGLCSVCNAVGIASHTFTWSEADADNCSGLCACGETTTRAHVYEYTSNGKGTDDTHTALCDCGNSFDEAHAWDNGKITKKVTYAANGVRTYTCADCGETRTEQIEVLDIPDSPFELDEGGQLHFYASTEKTPTVDGKVTVGEYALEIKNLVLADDENDDRFYTTLRAGRTFDLESVNAYVSYDSENIYFAVEVFGDESKSFYSDSIQVYIGTSGKTSELNMFYVPRVISGDVEGYPVGVDIANPQAAITAALPYVSAKKTTDDGKNITYELALKRDQLEIVDLEPFFFGILVTTGDATNAEIGNIYLGFETKGIEDIFPVAQRGKFYTHLLTLGEEIVETEPVETEPTVTEPTVTEPISDVITEPVATEDGCGASITTFGVALVMALGVCGVFVGKRKDN